jgi:hypothetical protein
MTGLYLQVKITALRIVSEDPTIILHLNPNNINLFWFPADYPLSNYLEN